MANHLPPDDFDRPEEQDDAPEADGSGNLTNWLLGGVIVVLAIIAVLVAWLVLSDDSEPQAQATTTTVATTVPGDTTSTTSATTTTQPVATTSTTEATTTTTLADTTTTTLPPTTTTSSTTSTTSTTSSTTTQPAPAIDPDAAAAVEAAQEWIEAIGAGDVDAAYALLDPASQNGVGGADGFAGLMTALQEGFGAWAGVAEGAVFVNEVDDRLWIVAIVAEVTREGFTELAAAPIPVVRGDGGFLVAAFRGDEPVQFAAPASGGTFPASGTFEFVVPTGVLTQAFVDNSATGPLTVTPQGEGTSRITARPQSQLTSGVHTLIVVYRNDDVLHADAIVFTV